MGKITAIVAKEIREAIPPIIFFLFLFHLIALTKAVLLDDYSLTSLRAISATVGALIVAKAILVIDVLPISRYFSDRLAIHVLWKALLYGIVVLLFKVVEEAIPLLLKHGDVMSTARIIYHEVHWPLFIVIALWVYSGLVLYSFAAELVSAVGPDRVKETFSGSRN